MTDNLAESTIYSTTDYSKFKKIQGNRPESKQHTRHLIQSFDANPELARTRPILVTKDWEIIDGQHRFAACQALGLPIYYTVGHNIDIATARLLNANQRSWQLKDYLASYIASGNPVYLKIQEYWDEYPLPLSALLIYLSGFQANQLGRSFRNGTFKIMKDKDLMLMRLDDLKDMSQYVDFWTDGVLAKAYLNIRRGNKDFDQDRFMDKLKFANMQRKSNTQDYMREIERIYNWNVKSEDKVMRLF